MAWVTAMANVEPYVEANMGQAQRWASVALSGLLAASLSLTAPGPARAASAGSNVLDWQVNGTVEAGGKLSFGERRSSKFNEYQDTDNGFVGELTLRGEKKDTPYFFDFKAMNPARDDQGYEGAFGRYGLFHVELGWDRTPHVLSNSAQTIFQEGKRDGSVVFTLPSTLRSSIASTFGTTSKPNDIRDTINGLTRAVDLSFNTDVGRVGFKFTPADEWAFDLEYSNLRRQGYRPVGTVIGSPGGSVTELAVPIENYTHEVKFGTEYARPGWAVQFNYTGSIFTNEFDAYMWDNPTTAFSSSTNSARGQLAPAPSNLAHTFSLTGSSALPLNSRVSGTLAYSLLRQDETFLVNTVNSRLTGAGRDFDDAGKSSPDAKADIILGNFQLSSRPIKNVSATVRYRYFEYQNDTPLHVFSFNYPEEVGTQVKRNTTQERFTKQNAGFDIGWRLLRPVFLKAGYDYEHWNRGDREASATNEHTGKFSADVTPTDWLLGRVTYSHANRYVGDYRYSGRAENSQHPLLVKFDEADRARDRLDLLLQFTGWDTVTPSLNFGFARDDYYESTYGLKKNDYFSGGASMGWTPLNWLQVSMDYTYENYKYTQQSRYRAPGVDTAANDWESKSKDDFHTLGLNTTLDLIPKKFDLTLGYAATFGFTRITTRNLTIPPASVSNNGPGTPPNNATARDWDKISNVLHTIKVVGRYHVTDKLQARLGYAYERYEEGDFARDPMKPFMGDVDGSTAGIQSVFLGATQPNYEAHILSFFLRYGF